VENLYDAGGVCRGVTYWLITDLNDDGGVGVVANVSLTGLLLKCLILGISDQFY